MWLNRAMDLQPMQKILSKSHQQNPKDTVGLASGHYAPMHSLPPPPIYNKNLK